MSRANSEYNVHKPMALALNKRYDFGGRIICRMLLIDCNVQVPYWVVQSWLNPKKLRGLKK